MYWERNIFRQSTQNMRAQKEQPRRKTSAKIDERLSIVRQRNHYARKAIKKEPQRDFILFFPVFLQLQVADFSDTHRTSEKKQVKQQQKESNFVGRYPFRA